MQNIICEKDCVHQKDGWCELEPGIKTNRNADNCAYLTEQTNCKNSEKTTEKSDDGKYF